MRKPPRVLIAEDEALVRLDLAAIFTAAGFEVCGVAADGREAVTLALEQRPDAIVMDANMPGLDGVAAAREILAARDVPIVMLSGYRYGELIDRALDVGIRGYVAKPFAGAQVVEAVQAAIGLSLAS